MGSGEDWDEFKKPGGWFGGDAQGVQRRKSRSTRKIPKKPRNSRKEGSKTPESLPKRNDERTINTRIRKNLSRRVRIRIIIRRSNRKGEKKKSKDLKIP